MPESGHFDSPGQGPVASGFSRTMAGPDTQIRLKADATSGKGCQIWISRIYFLVMTTEPLWLRIDSMALASP